MSPKSGTDDKPRVVDAELLPKWQTLALGLYVGLVGVLLVGLLISVWPAIEKASTSTAVPAMTAERAADETERMSFFGLFHLEVTAGMSLLILVALFGGLGSFIHAATSFVEYTGNRRLARSWSWWYMLRVPIGASLALIMYFAFRGGLFATSAAPGDVNPYGVAALAGAAGLFSKQATAKLEELFTTLFRVAPGKGDERLKDGLENPKPVVTGTEPAQLTTGSEATLEVRGSGFVATSQVRLKRLETGEVLERRATFISDTQLGVALKADELVAGKLEITVVNPTPGGGTSDPVLVDVNAPEELEDELEQEVEEELEQEVESELEPEVESEVEPEPEPEPEPKRKRKSESEPESDSESEPKP